MFGPPLQLFGARFGQLILVGTAQSGVSHPWISLWPQEAIPPDVVPLQGGGLLLGTWDAPFKANAYGARGIFRICQARVGCGPAPGPTFKRPCTVFLRLVGRMINTVGQTPVFGTPLQWFGVHFGRPCFRQPGSVGCCLSTEDFLRPQWGRPPRLLPSYGGLGIFGNAGCVWATALWPHPP